MAAETEYYEEREIDLIDLMLEVLSHWRGMIIALVLGCVLLGGYSYYTSYRAAKAQSTAAPKSEAQIESALTDLQKINVRQVILSEEQIAELEDYLESYAGQDIYAGKVAAVDLALYIQTDEDNLEALEAAYRSILTSAEMQNSVEQACGLERSLSELFYLDLDSTGSYTGVGSAGSSYNGTTNPGVTYAGMTYTGVLSFHFYYADAETCGKIADAFLDFAESKAADLRKSIGEHRLVLLNRSEGEVLNRDFSDVKYNIQTSILTLEKSVATAIDAFSAEETAYYEQLKSDEEEREAEAADSGAAAESVSTAQVPAAGSVRGTVSKKYAGIGALAGVLLVAFWYCYRYIVDRKLKDSDSLSRLYGISELGNVTLSGKAQKKNTGIDRKLREWKRRGRKVLPEAEALRVTAAETASVCGVNGAKKIAIVGAEDEGSSSVAKNLCEALGKSGIEADSLGNILYSAENLAKISEYDGAVLVETFRGSEYEEIENRIGALNRQKVRILGGILVG